MPPGHISFILSYQDASQVAQEGVRHARQAKWHANIAVRWTLAPTNARRPEALLRCSPVEPWNVDADAQPAVLARMGGYARWWVAVAMYGPCLLKLLGRLDDELLSTEHSSPRSLLRETCGEACFHMVPERLPQIGRASCRERV